MCYNNNRGNDMKKIDSVKEEVKKSTSKGKIVMIIGIVVLVLTLAIGGIVIWLFTEQYNSNGVSHFLVISIDPNKERTQIGKLDGYNVYVEGLSEYNFRTIDAKDLSVKKAIEKKLVSIEEWKKYAFSTKKSNDTLILVFENYEIALTGDECLIRPRL